MQVLEDRTALGQGVVGGRDGLVTRNGRVSTELERAAGGGHGVAMMPRGYGAPMVDISVDRVTSGGMGRLTNTVKRVEPSALGICVVLLSGACGSADGGAGGTTTATTAGTIEGADGAEAGASSDSGEPWPGSINCPDPGSSDAVDGLRHLGRAEYGVSGSFLEILDVVADGTTVYQCTATQGLMVFDAEANGPPRLLAERVGGPAAHPSFPRCQHVGPDFANGRLVITNRGDEIQPTPFFTMFDIADPAAPVALATWEGEASIEGVVLDGDVVYAAAHREGLLMFERQDAELVQVAAYTDANSDAWQPQRVGDTLVVAEGATGLRTYGIADGAPQLLATLPLPGSSKDVIVVGDVAYVASSSFIAAVDVSDPTEPRLLAERDVLGTALAVAMGQNATLLVAEWDEVRGYDASESGDLAPIVSQIVPTEGAFSRVLTVEAVPTDPGRQGRVYAGEWEGLHAYAQSDCAYGPEIWVTPDTVQFGVQPAGDSQTQVVIVRNTGNQTLQVDALEVSDPEMAVDASSLTVEPGQARAVEVSWTASDTALFVGDLSITSNDLDEPTTRLRVAGNLNFLGVGHPVPPFELFDLDGQLWSSTALRGQVTVLAYFATF